FEEVVALLAGHLHAEALVGDDAPGVLILALGAGLVEVGAAGPPEGGDRDLELSAVKALNVLHAALAEAALAHDDGPLVILQARRDNFAGAGAALVHEADHGEVEVAADLLAAVRFHLADARADADDLAVVDEQVGNRHGATQEPARVEAEVHDQPAQAIPVQL